MNRDEIVPYEGALKQAVQVGNYFREILYRPYPPPSISLLETAYQPSINRGKIG